MDQFDKAVIRAKKFQDKRIRHQPLHEGSISKIDEVLMDSPMAPPRTIEAMQPVQPQELKIKTPAKRTNEIAITIYVDGEEINLTARVNLADIISSQRNRAGLMTLFREALKTKFGKVDIQ